MMEEDIQCLHRAWKIPPTTEVIVRAAGNEMAPEPRDGKYVVFAAHFACGFGLPASMFF